MLKEHGDKLGADESHLVGAGSHVDLTDGNSKAVIEFMSTRCAILESAGHVRIALERYGRLNNRVIFK